MDIPCPFARSVKLFWSKNRCKGIGILDGLYTDSQWLSYATIRGAFLGFFGIAF
jgi:hypothetical protein